MKGKKEEVDLKKIRQAIADYMWSEGCSCCQNIDAHNEHKAVLAALLKVPKYKDGSGYNFAKFRSGSKHERR